MKKMLLFFITASLCLTNSYANDVSDNFKQLLSLEGKWQGTLQRTDGTSDAFELNYSITSNGSALLEESDTGGIEMLTIFNAQNDEVLSTHYCGLQNKPVSVLKSKQVLSIINVLEEEGFIKGYTENRYTLDVWLKYVEGVSVIQNIKVISKPSKRVYFSIPDLIDWRNKTNTFDILILSTTQGILTDEVALEKRVGGEILCIIK